MIFITTGTQEPFDRLVKVADEIAALLPGVIFKVQAFTAQYQATHIDVVNFMTPLEFEENMKNASLIISHAGMGTIISALVNMKPIIVMPRMMKYKEHRNEHQFATAKKLDALQYVDVAYDENELRSKVLEMWPDKLRCLHQVGKFASQQLIDSLQTYIKE
ncbi:glycosyltransferase [Pedobacter sp. MC2016-15]|uniref:glycosyltransferase n=1 Tax=Pedobacter sp. MC2016-15 TaxID=2994473 RepID=UPI0022453942|nr:glycosyltransferase [Pedobacter sp. MC2016-15]MCX2477740.1 glycosyltransferase [Pedobacter sp. MC2016-15]